MSDLKDKLVKFRDRLADARKGYEQAVGDVDDAGLRALFTRATEEKTAALAALSSLLPPEDRADPGTLIGSVTQVIVAARAAVTGDESLLPGMIDGEKRVLAACDEARAAAGAEPSAEQALRQQRTRIVALIDDLEKREAMAD